MPPLLLLLLLLLPLSLLLLLRPALPCRALLPCGAALRWRLWPSVDQQSDPKNALTADRLTVPGCSPAAAAFPPPEPELVLSSLRKSNRTSSTLIVFFEGSKYISIFSKPAPASQPQPTKELMMMMMMMHTTAQTQHQYDTQRAGARARARGRRARGSGTYWLRLASWSCWRRRHGRHLPNAHGDRAASRGPANRQYTVHNQLSSKHKQSRPPSPATSRGVLCCCAS